MNSNSSETNQSASASVANNNNKDNNNVISDPLRSMNNQNNNGTTHEYEDDMTEVNLGLELSAQDQNGKPKSLPTNTAEGQTITTEKSKWVKFDEENNERQESKNLPNTIAKTDVNNQSVDARSIASVSPRKINNSTAKSETIENHAQVGKMTSSAGAPSSEAAVLRTESVHVNIDGLNSSHLNAAGATTTDAHNISLNLQNSMPKSTSIPISSSSSPSRTVELSTGIIREGFANGDIIVNLLPTNTKWPWITPAVFRPELVPEELMAQGLTLTVEEYVAAMETLVNDYRFTMYNICYKRVLVCWIAFAFCVLLVLLFSGLQGIALFSLGVAWLFLNAAAIFACMWMKLRLARGLEKCMGRVNKQLLRHKILLILDDRAKISCHKVNLCFMYFDPAQCIAFLNEFMERQEQLGNSIQAGWEKKLDIDVNDIVIQGSNPVRLSRKQAVAQEIFLTYLQRWGKDFLRRRLDWTCNEAGVHEQPRHLMSSVCPCQYEEEILHSKIKLEQDKERCCCGLHNPFKHL